MDELPQNPVSPPPPVPSHGKQKILASVIGVIILVIIVTVPLTIKQFIHTSSRKPSPIPSHPSLPSPTIVKTPLSQFSSSVTWSETPEPVQSRNFFGTIDHYYPYIYTYMTDTDLANQTGSPSGQIITDYESKATYYRVGQMTDGIYKGGTIYLVIVKGLPDANVFKGFATLSDIHNTRYGNYLFIETPDKKIILTSDYTNDYLFCGGSGCGQDSPTDAVAKQMTGILHDRSLTLDPAAKKYAYTDSLSKINFSLEITSELFTQGALFLVKDFGTIRLYSDQDIQAKHFSLKQLLQPQLVVRLPTGLKALASIKSIDFVVDGKTEPDQNYYYSQIRDAHWSSSDTPALLSQAVIDKNYAPTPNHIGYSTDYAACTGGTIPITDTTQVTPQTDLRLVAGTTTKDTLYELTTTSFPAYQLIYDKKITERDLADSLPYADYLRLKPFLIWKNALGMYTGLYRDDVIGAGCYGEPLIYLYPEKKMSISVQLASNISLTKSTPKYEGSWQVTAEPDGTLTNLQRTYPYLFWEGNAIKPSHPVIEAVVAEKDIHTFLDKTLGILGLTKHERSDFTAYWEPKLTGSPYFWLSFSDASELNTLIPLTISPKPHTIIRVMMTYKGLEKKILVPARMDYQTPQRKGFTVVEWGGMLH